MKEMVERLRAVLTALERQRNQLDEELVAVRRTIGLLLTVETDSTVDSSTTTVQPKQLAAPKDRFKPKYLQILDIIRESRSSVGYEELMRRGFSKATVRDAFTKLVKQKRVRRSGRARYVPLPDGATRRTTEDESYTSMALAYIVAHDGTVAADLTRKLGVGVQTARSILRNLKKQGLVRARSRGEYVRT